ncbi:hypothetical protein GYMLUDRAFT_614488 [Collybiopsis luxurians FD-317 M1]|uniref:Unplaced genomic scaffold GYMLUscaffold_28, whole genome shotgun sequence n=1 Tax=Collybiopsis luxurians FD-317 M1 TaxID=944289 RepID=A0A0D0B9A1_9AGAR|nr:hypothetical protein GYMLUDRAFT_614488 [Collybiopsis luxurians FD-317 M1]
MAEPVKATHGKSRTSNACDMCRRRKVRCDSATMPGNFCSECIKWKTECTHKIVKRRRGPKTRSSRRPSMPRAKLKDLVSSIVDSADSYILPNDLDFVRTLVIDLALHIRVLEAELKESREFVEATPSSMSSTPSNIGKSDADATDDDSEYVSDELAERFELLAIGKKRHHGSSSTFQLVRNALDIKGQLVGKQLTLTIDTLKRPEFWSTPKWQVYPEPDYPPYVFPEDDLLHHLIDLYFTKVNPYYPMLHRPTLEKSLWEGLHLTDRGFGAIILMVCTLGSQYSDDPRTLIEGTNSEHSKGWGYFRQIRLIHSFIQNKIETVLSLYEFQLYPLAAFYLHTTNVANATFFLIGLGIRSAHQKGVHERHFVVPNDPIETELWKRAFWCLMVFDIYGSATLGRPRATTVEDFDVEFPQECDDDEYLEITTSTPPSSDPGPGTSSSQPHSKLSTLSFWTHYLKLYEIIGAALRTLYSVRTSDLSNGMGMGISASEWNRKAVVELDVALNEWVNSIPAYLKWNPENQQHEIFFHQSVMLYATYYWAQFQVHKLFIYRSAQSHSESDNYDEHDTTTPTPASTIFSFAVCASAARSCIGVLEIQHGRRPFLPLPLLIVSCAKIAHDL